MSGFKITFEVDSIEADIVNNKILYYMLDLSLHYTSVNQGIPKCYRCDALWAHSGIRQQYLHEFHDYHIVSNDPMYLTAFAEAILYILLSGVTL